ncbi:LAFA_0C05908g1_1 [Lachancea sp. 'fantastica']|nr:LAFA_0C05908g1_1 [Lachancea sp. 'fantastica']
MLCINKEHPRVDRLFFRNPLIVVSLPSMSTSADPKQISEAVDALARSILAQRVSKHQNKPERLRKLESLKQQFDALLQADRESRPSSSSVATSPLRLDAAQLDIELQQGLKTVAVDGTQYVLLPLLQGIGSQTPTEASSESAKPATTKKKKKKNKISCSYCNTTGHTRANCDRKTPAPTL